MVNQGSFSYSNIINNKSWAAQYIMYGKVCPMDIMTGGQCGQWKSQEMKTRPKIKQETTANCHFLYVAMATHQNRNFKSAFNN